MKNIGIIGFGNMGEAIAAGLQSASKGYKLGVIEIDGEKKARARDRYGAELFTNSVDLLRFSDILILAVKPQSLDSLTAALKEVAEEELKNSRILSIAAGKNIDYFTDRLGTAQVVRFMPNIAATVGRSVVGIAFCPGCSKEFRAAALEIAGSIGLAVELPEHLIPSITGLSGSGIAFVYSFLHAMTLGGVSQGIDYSKSLEIAVETLRGAADMVSAFGGPAELITRVCSPAGTTIEGIKVLEDERFTAVVMDAIEAAARKAALMEG